MARWPRLLLVAAAAAVLATPAAAADPAELVEAFDALCVQGRPDSDDSIRRALAAGWRVERSVDLSAVRDLLAPGQSLAGLAMVRRQMVLVLLRHADGGPASIPCAIVGNVGRSNSAGDIAAIVSRRLGSSGVAQPTGGEQQELRWVVEPGFEVVAVLYLRGSRALTLSVHRGPAH